jgi:transcriptional regulator with XRE-family HTH domain
VVVERLRATVESRGSSIYRVEKQLERGRGYVADALRGDKKISVELICEVLAVIGVEPEEFFGKMIPSRRGGEPSHGEQPPWRRRGRRPKAAALPPPPSRVSTLVQAVLIVLARRGVLSLDEVEQAERELSG